MIREILEKYVENEYNDDGSIEYQFIYWGDEIDELEKELYQFISYTFNIPIEELK